MPFYRFICIVKINILRIIIFFLSYFTITGNVLPENYSTINIDKYQKLKSENLKRLLETDISLKPVPTPLDPGYKNYTSLYSSKTEKITPRTAVPNIQLCLILDSSGSIGETFWKVIVSGIALSIDGRDAEGYYHPESIAIPHDGSVELSMVIFSSTVFYKVFSEGANVVLTDNNYKYIADEIRKIDFLDGMTNFPSAFVTAGIVLNNSPYYVDAKRRLINISTDGLPQDQTGSLTERNNLIPILTAYNAEGEIDVECLGGDYQWVASKITYPYTSETGDNIFKLGETINKNGFVLLIENFNNYPGAFKKKLNYILQTPTPYNTPTASPSPFVTKTPTPSPSPSRTPSPTPSFTPTPSPTPSPIITPLYTSSPTPTPLPIYKRWNRIETNQSPSNRYECCMIYDSQDRSMVLFGGHDGTSTGRFFDTWKYNKISWNLIDSANPPQTHPLGSGPGCFTYDSNKNIGIYFGGYDDINYLNETYEYINNRWFLKETTNSPSKRYASSIVYDKTRKKVVLFGGYGQSPNNPLLIILLNDTWEYDGNNWTQIQTQNYPSARCNHCMVYDTFKGKTLLFGGKTADNQVWEYDGSNWNMLITYFAPVERYSHSMAYDESHNITYLYGGYNFGNYYDETWQLKHDIWTKIETINSPSFPFQGSMIWNPYDKLIYYFGGKKSDGNISNQLWYYENTGLAKGSYFYIY